MWWNDLRDKCHIGGFSSWTVILPLLCMRGTKQEWQPLMLQIHSVVKVLSILPESKNDLILTFFSRSLFLVNAFRILKITYLHFSYKFLLFSFKGHWLLLKNTNWQTKFSSCSLKSFFPTGQLIKIISLLCSWRQIFKQCLNLTSTNYEFTKTRLADFCIYLELHMVVFCKIIIYPTHWMVDVKSMDWFNLTFSISTSLSLKEVYINNKYN